MWLHVVAVAGVDRLLRAAFEWASSGFWFEEIIMTVVRTVLSKDLVPVTEALFDCAGLILRIEGIACNDGEAQHVIAASINGT